jgi:hypothetical protein
MVVDQRLDYLSHFQSQGIEMIERMSLNLVLRCEEFLVYLVQLLFLTYFEAVLGEIQILLRFGVQDGTEESMYGREVKTVLLNDLLNVLFLVSVWIGLIE